MLVEAAAVDRFVTELHASEANRKSAMLESQK
jgi:hypothetical protein